MPTSFVLLLPLLVVTAYALNWYLCFRRNIRRAKASGIPYVVVPVFAFDRAWLVTNRLWFKLARRTLPASWVDPWIDFTKSEFPWELGHELFKRIGTDTFLAVSGGDFCMWTADADVISQLVARKNDFPKPGHMYRALNIYGKNVVSAEGHDWRRHRKLTNPMFTERNNQLVWSETIDQTQEMLRSWIGNDGKGDRTTARIMDDTMRLSLYVISRAGFGRKLEWPRSDAASPDMEEISHDPSKIDNRDAEKGEGHSMSFVYALHSLLQSIIWLIILPLSILKRSPLKMTRRAYESYTEWGNYMREMIAAKKAALRSGRGMDEMDIVGQLVKGQVFSPEEKSPDKDEPLSDSEIMGNAFVLTIAGHESTANTIHYAILLLALNIAAQRSLQRDLDSHFDGRPISDWDYERDLPGLFGGMTGAVMNEELRLVPPAVNIPKSTYGVGEQTLMVNGRACTVPANTFINLCVSSTHRNPKWWPSCPAASKERSNYSTANESNDLEDFKPERWFVTTGDRDETKEEFSDEGAFGTDSNAAPSFYRPPKGAFIPFSEGARACLGRRFAQVEVLAALAVIFSQYSVELAVDKYATDEEVDRMDRQARKEVWQKAADDARRMIKGSSTIITLQMRQGHVPVRFVRKGEERFDLSS